MPNTSRIVVFRLVAVSVLGIGFSEAAFAETGKGNPRTAAPAAASTEKKTTSLFPPIAKEPEAISPQPTTESSGSLLERVRKKRGSGRLLTPETSDSILERVRSKRLSGRLLTPETAGSIVERVRSRRLAGRQLAGETGGTVIEKVREGGAKGLSPLGESLNKGLELLEEVAGPSDSDLPANSTPLSK